MVSGVPIFIFIEFYFFISIGIDATISIWVDATLPGLNEFIFIFYI